MLQYGKNSQEAKDLAAQIEDLSGELAQNKNKLKQAEDAADKFDQSLVDVDESARKASDGFTVFKGALANLVSQGISRAIEGVKDLAKQTFEVGSSFESGMANVGAISGATASDLDKLTSKAEEMGSKTKFSATEAAALPLMPTSISSKTNMSRKRLVTILSIIGCLCSLVFTCGISSYLVGIVDDFVNKFGILLLIAVQCVVFGWYYGAKKVIPVLNEKSRVKIGFIWTSIIKYILPIFLVIIWLIGIIDLFMNANQFELMVDIGLIIIVAVLSYVFYSKSEIAS